ncbi:hypothetical protein SUGI_0504440 [Cryptomeria japonica]|nr:hypothetical protein SUGI_0504440 [Cryptomeria japonica]
MEGRVIAPKEARPKAHPGACPPPLASIKKLDETLGETLEGERKPCDNIDHSPYESEFLVPGKVTDHETSFGRSRGIISSQEGIDDKVRLKEGVIILLALPLSSTGQRKVTARSDPVHGDLVIPSSGVLGKTNTGTEANTGQEKLQDLRLDMCPIKVHWL